MELTVAITIHHEQGSYWSQVDRHPGIHASGRTLTELHEAIGEANGLYFTDRPAEVLSGELAVGHAVLRVRVDDAQLEPTV